MNCKFSFMYFLSKCREADNEGDAQEVAEVGISIVTIKKIWGGFETEALLFRGMFIISNAFCSCCLFLLRPSGLYLLLKLAWQWKHLSRVTAAVVDITEQAIFSCFHLLLFLKFPSQWSGKNSFTQAQWGGRARWRRFSIICKTSSKSSIAAMLFIC